MPADVPRTELLAAELPVIVLIELPTVVLPVIVLMELPAVVLPVIVLPVDGVPAIVPREFPVVVLPVFGLGEVMLTFGMAGGGNVIIGLTPPPSISVAPSGMVPLASNEPGVGSGDAMPVDGTVADAPELQLLEDVPPPSKVEPGEVVDWVI